MKTKIPLKLDGVVVHPQKDWPRPLYHGYGGRDVRVPIAKALLHTTQHSVSPDRVAQKIAAINAGEVPRIELVRDSFGRLWILDGHHTLAAYRALGQTPHGFLYDPGGDILAKPPRFQGVRP